MATFELTGPDGGTYHVDAPDEHAALSAFSAFNGGKSAPAAPADPVSTNNVGRSFATGVPIIGGLLNKADAATNAGLSYALNPLFDEKDQLTGSIGDRYNKSLAIQNGMDQKFEDQHPIVDMGAKLAGGAAAMAPVMAAAPGVMGVTGGFAARTGAGMASNAAIGGTDAAIRGGDPVSGALVGAALPLAFGLAGQVAKGVTAPIFANVKARFNPDEFANSQFARVVHDSGQTPEQVGQAVVDGNAAGQQYTPADALGSAGQKALAAAVRGPGEGNTLGTRFLNERQAGQGDRISDILDEGLGTGNTARQSIDQLTEQARRESAPLYREALDKQPVWNDRMQQFFDDPVTAKGLREGVDVQRLEALATGNRFDPSDYAITHFNEAGDPVVSGVPNMRTINLIKKGWDQMLEQYRDKTTGRLALDEKGRALDQVRRSFLNEVDGLNPKYGEARATYAGPAQVREAVGVGADAASRGRAADNIARFRAMTDPSKQGYRIGYADKRLGKIESTPGVGSNKGQPLTSQKAQQELGELSLHQGPTQPGQAAPMQQRLDREQTMFETRARALGGSKTAENMADDEALTSSPEFIGAVTHILHGNPGGAVASIGKLVANGWTGNTPAVRAAMARMLLDRGVTPANLQAAVGQTVQRIQFIENLTRNLGRGATGAIAVNRPGQSVN